MIINRHRVLFFPEKEAGKDDALLRCRVKWDGSRRVVAVNVGCRVNPDKWDPKAQECMPRSFHGAKKTPAAVINREITRVREVVEDLFDEYNRQDMRPTKDELRSALRIRLGLEAPADLSVAAKSREFRQEESQKGLWARGTLQKFNTVFAHIEAWRPDLQLDEIDEDALADYVGYLRDGLELKNSTIKKNLSFFKWFLRWCAGKGYLTRRDFETFAPKFKDTQREVIYLAWDELQALYSLRIPEARARYAQVRDLFCFCAFTSLRFSDAQALRWCDVHPDHLSVTTIKTADSLRIELNSYSRAILDQYALEAYPGGAVFPKIASQVMNRYIKEDCKAAGICEPVRRTYYQGARRIDEIKPKYELIGSHAARRTFVCNALSLGIPAAVVMKWTGHSDYDAMKPYIDITREATRENMEKFNKDPELDDLLGI